MCLYVTEFLYFFLFLTYIYAHRTPTLVCHVTSVCTSLSSGHPLLCATLLIFYFFIFYIETMALGIHSYKTVSPRKRIRICTYKTYMTRICTYMYVYVRTCTFYTYIYVCTIIRATSIRCCPLQLLDP